jgi:hypothetical protein
VRILRSRLFLVCAVLFGVPLLWRYGIADWLAKREWESYARERRALGDRWTLAEFRPPPVPPEQDITKLSAFVQGMNYSPSLDAIPSLIGPRLKTTRARRGVDWKRTRDFAAQQSLAVDPTIEDDLLALDAGLRPYQSLVNELCNSRAVGANWGDGVWNPKLDSALPEFSVAMRCFRLLRVRAGLDIALGRPDSARRCIEANLRIARALAHAPTLLGNLTTSTGVTNSRETVWLGLENDAWDDATLAAFTSAFLQINSLGDFKRALETERVWARALYEADLPVGVLPSPVTGRFDEAAMDSWLLHLTANRPAFRYRNLLWMYRHSVELGETLDAESGVWRPKPRRFDPEDLTSSQRKRDLFLAASAAPGFEVFHIRAVYEHAQNQMTAIACALARAHRASGAYPSSLEVLVPTYLPHMPIDPASGSPFRYRPTADGTYLLYSVGIDQQDQDGAISEDQEISADDPDWLWFTPSPPAAPARP